MAPYRVPDAALWPNAMPETDFDTIIVGAGIAGASLAWALREAGQRVLVLDACEPVTASRIAAGLVTPITGLRLTLQPDFARCLEAARAFYGRIETITHARFFYARTAVRLFQSDRDRRYFSERSAQPEFRAQLVDPQPDPLLAPTIADAADGGFVMQAAQLDVAALLAVTRRHVPHVSMKVDWRRDVVFDPGGVQVGGYRARHVVSCEGFAASANPYLGALQFNAAKGDILTLRLERAIARQVIHRGIWIAPTAAPDVVNVGATYDLENLVAVPSPTARAEIESKLGAFFRVPYTLIDHRAAVRPIIRQSHPSIGLHADFPQLGFFNGLGSRGALLAPRFGGDLAAQIVGAASPDGQPRGGG